MEWTGARYADNPTVQVQTWIGALPGRVWELVSDIELMPTMSQELQSVEWLDGASEPAVGAKFIGRSKHESLGEWATTSHVIECEPQRVFAWAVEDPANPTAIWRACMSRPGGRPIRGSCRKPIWTLCRSSAMRACGAGG